MKINALFVLFTIIFSCNNNPNKNQSDPNLHLLDYGTFTIQVPRQWKKIEVGSPEDSYVGQIQVNEKTLISFDLGMYSNSLNEDDDNSHYEIEDGKVFLIDKTSTANNQKLKYFGIADSVTLKKVRRNKVERIDIDGKSAKLISPKKHGDGLTGVYIDNLWMERGSKVKIQLCAYDLTEKQEQQLLTAIKSLRFYQNKPFLLK